MKFSAGEFEKIDFTDAQGNAQSLRARNGVFTAETPEEIHVARSFGLTERTEAQVAAATKRRTSSKTRAQAGKTGKIVQISGEATDTRGPGAPADEPGVTETKEG